ncbi:MAG TPA: GNAT family N-acetyltransferase [Acidimicrobiia bacterium]|jgi:GNAT superfamily N-acetyltransferase|nr:GNAT family N-acetyltransferase [Acidimicrobiia bacterium]
MNATDPTGNDVMRIDGTDLVVRPITLHDVERLARLFTRLSPQSVHFRFFSPISRPPRAVLLRLADVDHTRRDALVALDGDEIVAVARYDGRAAGKGPEASHRAEIAITVEDAWQHRGVGKRLARRLAALAADRGYDTFVATMLPDNRAALGLVRKLVPDATVRWAGGEYEADMPLGRAS